MIARNWMLHSKSLRYFTERTQQRQCAIVREPLSKSLSNFIKTIGIIAIVHSSIAIVAIVFIWTVIAVNWAIVSVKVAAVRVAAVMETNWAAMWEVMLAGLWVDLWTSLWETVAKALNSLELSLTLRLILHVAHESCSRVGLVGSPTG